MSNWQQQLYESWHERTKAALDRLESIPPEQVILTGAAKQTGSTAKRQTMRKPKTDYKAIFLTHLKAAKLPEPVCEFRFHETRKWRFDYAFPAEMIAIEYQGLNWKGGGNSGHQSIDGLRNDCEKFTEASLAGWRLILITAETVNNGKAVEWVRRALHGEKQ